MVENLKRSYYAIMSQRKLDTLENSGNTPSIIILNISVVMYNGTTSYQFHKPPHTIKAAALDCITERKRKFFVAKNATATRCV
jgi:hypothetical protein